MGFSAMVYRISRIAADANSMYSLTHWISRSGGSMVSRSSRIAADANSTYSVCGNRMMSCVSRSKSASLAPWALLPCMHSCMECCGRGYTLYSLANKEVYNTYVLGSDAPSIVGSSQGWVSFYDDLTHTSSHKMFLSDPLANRVIELPPLDTVPVRLHSVIPGEDGRLAVATFGDGSNLAFFSRRRRSCGWIPLVNPSWGEKKRVYDGVAYSSRHKRLFCITSAAEDDNSKLELECWDLELESPRVEETMEIDLGYPLVKETRKLKYLVLAEHTGEMFVVVWHVASYKDNIIDVYKIEREGGGGRPRAVRMEDSLEGVAMFVGNNQGLALPAEEHSGILNPNCLYFTSDNRVNHDGMQGKMLDYKTKEISLLPPGPPFISTRYHLTWFVPSKL